MYRLTDRGVIRTIDNLHIPANTDSYLYQDFLRWQAAGNTPDPIDSPDESVEALRQIERIENETKVPRMLRELALVTMQDLAERQAIKLQAAGQSVTAAAILAANTGYQKTKAVDDQIKELRRKLT